MYRAAHAEEDRTVRSYKWPHRGLVNRVMKSTERNTTSAVEIVGLIPNTTQTNSPKGVVGVGSGKRRRQGDVDPRLRAG